ARGGGPWGAGLWRSAGRGADTEAADVPRLGEPGEAPVARGERTALTLRQCQIDAVRKLVAEVEGQQQGAGDEVLVVRETDHAMPNRIEKSCQARGSRAGPELTAGGLPAERSRCFDEHETPGEPADRPAEQGGRSLAVRLVHHPLDGDGRVDDGGGWRASPRHPAPAG